jgi:LemA protein
MEVLVKTMKPTSIISMLLTLLSLSACGINHSLAQDNDVKAAFADVLDLYYTRLEIVADATTLARKYLPLNAPELALVDNTRAAVADLHATPDLIDTRASFERFDVAQRQLTEAISQLMIACEGVHRLNADARFHIVQSRLASSAGQIALARERYDSAARRYNASLHGFPLDPAEAIHAAPDKPTFSVRDGSPVHRHPRTDFGALRGSLRV